jgi:hypothetical protein
VAIHPRVLISYSHDSPAHKERTLELAQSLRGDGIDARIDQFVPAPAQGWPQWMEDELRQADFVIVVCTKSYRRRFEATEAPGVGRGASWESQLVKQRLYDNELTHETLVSVLFDDGDDEDVPTLLRAGTRLVLPEDYDSLLARLARQPAVHPATLGPAPAPSTSTSSHELRRLRDENLQLRAELARERSAIASADPFERFARSLREGRPDVAILADEMFEHVLERLDKAAPPSGTSDDELVEVLDHATPLLDGISTVASLAARMDQALLAERAEPFFTKLLLRHNPPPGFVGSFRDRDFDFFRSVGKECFVALFEPFLSEGRWAMVRVLLDAVFDVPNLRNREPGQGASYRDLSAGATTGDLFARLSGEKWYSPFGHVLEQRHKAGVKPAFAAFRAADLFLYFASEFSGIPTHHGWWPHTALYPGDTPSYLVRASQPRYAEELATVLGLPSAAQLGYRLQAVTAHLRQQRGYEHVLGWFDFGRVAQG